MSPFQDVRLLDNFLYARQEQSCVSGVAGLDPANFYILKFDLQEKIIGLEALAYGQYSLEFRKSHCRFQKINDSPCFGNPPISTGS